MPSFPDYTDNFAESHVLDSSLQRDIAWALVNAIGSDCLQRSKPGNNLDEMTPVGSWTAFMKDTSSMETIKCKLEDLSVVPFPPSDNIVKWYMDMDLELNHVFVHDDEAINSKIHMTMWLHQGRYEKMIPLIGGFHTLLVHLKIFHKTYGCSEAT